MENTLCVAKVLYDMYYEQKGVQMDGNMDQFSRK